MLAIAQEKVQDGEPRPRMPADFYAVQNSFARVRTTARKMISQLATRSSSLICELAPAST